MALLRRYFKNIIILLITLIVCLSVLLIGQSINDKINGKEAQGFSSSLRKLRPVDLPGVVKQVASRINGDVAHRNDVSVKEAASYDDDDGDVDGNESDVGEDEEDGDVLQDVDGVDGDAFDGGVIGADNVMNGDQMNKMEQLNLDPSMLKIKEKMIDRQDHLHTACARMGLRKLNLENPKDMSDVIAHKGNLDTLFWNDKYKFVASVIYKSGSGNWRKFLKALADSQGKVINFPPQIQKAHYTPDKALSTLTKRPPEVKYRLAHYVKIVTVRHPLIRFLSGYRDKFIEHVDRYRKDIPKMIIDSRKGDARASRTKHVTFSEFADFIVSPGTGSDDPHWTPQHIRSRPCEHNYAIIVKLETSDDDVDKNKRVVGIGDNMRFRSEYTDRHTVSNNETLVTSYYQQLSEETFQAVCDSYRADFELFGYYRPKSVKDVARIFDDFF
eukprot:XP_003727357.1 PREDICTED: carbohydrate sulfotransferase 14 [Strongylocentrotus purpuratus]